MTRVLVVDDSPVDRQLFQGILQKEPDFEVAIAEDGRLALAAISTDPPEVVITDLQMPNMDGLRLVQELRGSRPSIPVILATGFGSEDTAAAALNAGAAGYVPKSQLATTLVPTVRDALKLMHAEQSYTRLIDSALSTEFEFKFANEVELVPPAVHLCQKMIAGMCHTDLVEQLRMGVAIEQALHNAIFRGNLEIGSEHGIPFGDENPHPESAKVIDHRMKEMPYCDRQVYLRFSVTPERFICTIRDEGPGFDTQRDADVAVGRERGLILMRSFMDEVNFNEVGNEVTLIREMKRSVGAEQPQQAAVPVEDPDVDMLIAAPADESPSEEAKESPSDDVVQLRKSTGDRSLGILISRQSGRSIELTAPKQLVGRRDTCHIVLPYHEVSSHHCQLFLVEGWWFVKDLKSSNGTRINGKKVDQGRLDPGDRLCLARYEYEIQYSPAELGAEGPTRPETS